MWLSVPAEEFTCNGSSPDGDDNTLAVISAHVRAKKKRSRKSAETMEEIVRAAYERFKEE